MLAAHTENASCATCHQRIDPIGFMLENDDPVGRWRTQWPKGNAKIDASGVLPDGTRIRDVVDFKRWLTKNVDRFSRCLAEKLMVYATGRELNYAERHENFPQEPTLDQFFDENQWESYRKLGELTAEETLAANGTEHG